MKGPWLRRASIALAVAYPVGLLLVTLLLRYQGESWWATGVGLYLPRIGFAVPLPLVVVLLLVCRLPRFLWAQLAAALIVLFPLMGLVITWPRRPPAGEPTLRILSFNVDSGHFGGDKIDEQIQRFSPDIVLLQEVQLDAVKLADVLHSRYPTVVSSNQFVIASRFPISEISNPERMLHDGRLRSQHFMRYLIETSLGPVALYNVHPTSPRSVFYELRGKGLTREILSGRVFSGWAAPDVQQNNELRAFQIEGAAAQASKEEVSIVIAGDTNLPGLSRVFAQFLSRYQDGFAEAGLGFGYTFQSVRPWMRIDRILASDDLRFYRFEVGCPGASDHLCVVADLARRGR